TTPNKQHGPHSNRVGAVELSRGIPAGALQRSDVLCLRALRALTDLELHLLVLLQAAVSRTLDFGVMHEHIRSAVLALNEAVALLSAEPLDGAFCHACLLAGSAGTASCSPRAFLAVQRVS